MRVVTKLHAPDGRQFDLEFSANTNYVIAWIRLNRRPVGCAKLLLRDGTAELADIQIFDRAPNVSRLLQMLPLKLFTKDFRGKGIGSLFLNAVCDHLRTSGIKSIEGTMSGNIDRLTPWYRKAGFVVDPISKSISKELVVHNEEATS